MTKEKIIKNLKGFGIEFKEESEDTIEYEIDGLILKLSNFDDEREICIFSLRNPSDKDFIQTGYTAYHMIIEAMIYSINEKDKK